jgi:hypothetical protein
MKCELIEIDKNIYKCKKCNSIIRTNKPPEKINRYYYNNHIDATNYGMEPYQSYNDYSICSSLCN